MKTFAYYLVIITATALFTCLCYHSLTKDRASNAWHGTISNSAYDRMYVVVISPDSLEAKAQGIDPGESVTVRISLGDQLTRSKTDGITLLAVAPKGRIAASQQLTLTEFWQTGGINVDPGSLRLTARSVEPKP